MGMTRKFMSVSSLGLVDFRSDKERTAAYTAATKRQSKKQTKLLKEQTKAMKAAAAAQQQATVLQSQPVPQSLGGRPTRQSFAATPSPPPPRVPAGWYPDQAAGVQRYWDGLRWTEHTAPLG
jgi:hypothetical protein